MSWAGCRFLTCSVLPVRRACNCTCPFCFSKSSISALGRDEDLLTTRDVESFYRFSRSRGARRLVITGGGEPLLRPARCLELVERGRPFFSEIALFTNGARLTPELARELRSAGLSYLCWSRHHDDDEKNRKIMGAAAPDADSFLAARGPLAVRATCVMVEGGISDRAGALRYLERFRKAGLREFTFKHTYVAYPHSAFGTARENHWAIAHQVQADPFDGMGEEEARLPWGPVVKRMGEMRVCHYYEPAPSWELENQLCRSSNLLADGRVYASLEDSRSLLFRLGSSSMPSEKTSSRSDPCSP